VLRMFIWGLQLFTRVGSSIVVDVEIKFLPPVLIYEEKASDMVFS